MHIVLWMVYYTRKGNYGLNAQVDISLNLSGIIWQTYNRLEMSHLISAL